MKHLNNFFSMVIAAAICLAATANAQPKKYRTREAKRTTIKEQVTKSSGIRYNDRLKAPTELRTPGKFKRVNSPSYSRPSQHRPDYSRPSYTRRDRNVKRVNRNYNYNYHDINHNHKVKVEVKRPHRDLYTALDVINTVANVVDAFTPDTPQVVQTQTIVPQTTVPTYTPSVQYETTTTVPSYAPQAQYVQPQYVPQPHYTQPVYTQPSVNEQPVNPAVTEPVYTQPIPQTPVVQPVVVQPTPVVVPQPVVTTPPPVIVQPPVQNTTVIVPPRTPYRRPYFPPRYYNRPYVPRSWWR